MWFTNQTNLTSSDVLAAVLVFGVDAAIEDIAWQDAVTLNFYPPKNKR